ncbi:unnamed protein product [Notodromas monacha]|uniref:Serine aminopeptidase S33 domain-containing protein n=1 Tax=Notodromas monacha TaxID=399045 RepID=A0A7R9G8S4_9CRUS|nr:unnamed protein product [Notodromas monacha]CAG0913521.1 unnamed protein product [Notodromas monacha]
MNRLTYAILAGGRCARPYCTRAQPVTKILRISVDRGVSYSKLEGAPDKYTVVYHPGFLSCKWGQKSTMLAEFCREKRLSFLTYEYEGVGESPGLSLDKTPFHNWVEDAKLIMENCTEGPVIFVASSMGTWLSTLGAQDFFDRVKGIILVGGAFNFLYKYYVQFQKFASSEDMEMPYQQMMQDIPMVFPEAKIDFYLRRNGYHRMAEPEDLQLLRNTLEELIRSL